MNNKMTSSAHGEKTQICSTAGVAPFSYGGRRKCLGIILLWCFLCTMVPSALAQDGTQADSIKINNVLQNSLHATTSVNPEISQKILGQLSLIDTPLDTAITSQQPTKSDAPFDAATTTKENTLPAAESTSSDNSEELTPEDIDKYFADDSYEEEPEEFFEPFSGKGENVEKAVSDKQTLPSEKVKFIERPIDTELFVEVVLDGLIIDSAITVYLDDDNELLIPLSVITDLLGFPIAVKPELGTAEGWFVREGNKFSLSPPYSMITIADQTSPVKGGIVEPHIDDIYVSMDLLSQWFPVKLTFNFGELRLHLDSEVTLPFVEAKLRKERWEKKEAQKAALDIHKNAPEIKLPYRKTSAPTIDVTQNIGYSRPSSGASNMASSHTIRSSNDLFGMNLTSATTVTTDSTSGINEISNIDLQLSREDYTNKMGGKLGAISFKLGDVTASPVPLAGGGKGRGFNVTNEPLNFVRSPEDFKIEGTGPAGWDVELYKNQNLISFQTVDENGLYSFTDLPLSEGLNLLRVVIYGPNGEITERIERFYIGQNMVPKGEFIYNLSYLESAAPVLNLSSSSVADSTHTLALTGEYGVSPKLSLLGGVYQGALSSSDMTAAVAGVRASLGSTFSQLNMLRTDKGATSTSLNLAGNLGKAISWNASHEEHSGYTANERSIKKKTTVSLSQPISLKLLPSFNYSLKAQQEVGTTGIKIRKYNNRLAFNAFGMNLINSLDYTEQVTSSSADTLTGELILRGKMDRGYWRGTLGYNLISETNSNTLERANLYVQKRLSDKLSLSGSLYGDFSDNKTYGIDGRVNLKLDKYRLALNAKVENTGSISLGANLGYSFIPRNIYGDYYMSKDSVGTGQGELIVKPFLDRNENNRIDEGEEAISGIVMKNMLRGVKARTDESGTAVLSGISPHIVNKITLDIESLPDIYMIPKYPVMKVIGKSGINGTLVFPVLSLGEISGIFGYTDINGEFTGLGEVIIALINKDGEVVAETETEYDGYYMFSSIPVGEYELFFPQSEALNNIYQGDGTGPKFKLTADEPEMYSDILGSEKTIEFYDAESN